MGTATRHFYIYNQSQSCDRNGKIKNENEIVLSKMCVIKYCTGWPIISLTVR